MQVKDSIFQLLKGLWHHITRRRRKQLGGLLFLILLTSFTEIISIGLVLPFLGVLSEPKSVFEYGNIQSIIKYFGITTPEQLLLPLTIVFAISVVFAGVMRLLLLWSNARLTFSTGADLSINIYRRTLYQPYSVHCSRNSSEIISGISSKVDSVIYNVIFSILNLVNAGIMLIVILAALFSIAPLITFWAFLGFGLIYASIITLTRKKLLIDSECTARESVQVIKSLQEGLGGIRDVLLDNNQEAYCQIFRNSDIPLRRAQANTIFISSSPRYVLEALGMLLIAILAYSLVQQADGTAKAIPILGALALGAQRLLPVLQLAYSSWISIQSGQIALRDTLELLEQRLPEYSSHANSNPLQFKKDICLRWLGFRYGVESPYVLKQINLTIEKGARIGFIGTTGSGKSTLLDIVMGLLQPTDGFLLIDGVPITPENNRAWQTHIAHVPQNIFLADSTIEENIAFGIPADHINLQRVKKVARQAQIADMIESWPEKYSTFVGERGIRLSGGQRQRIGIARALYKQADVIIFDEATSSLDGETEQAVMRAIEGLSNDLTLLIIAHRISTLKSCNQIVELSEGGIRRVGSYQDIVNQSPIIPQISH